MHAYIDAERFTGMTIDAALRLLLRNFRLPGLGDLPRHEMKLKFTRYQT